MPTIPAQLIPRRSAELLWLIQNNFTTSELARVLPLLISPQQIPNELLRSPEKLQALAASVLAVDRLHHLTSVVGKSNGNSESPKLITRFDIESLANRKLPDSFPLVLRYEGNPQLLALKKVGIVGSRHPTFYGREQAARFARALAESGVCVISGAAIGIDTVANVIAHNSGASVAVLGSGLENTYPRANKGLFQCLEHSGRGLLLSEFPDQQRAEKWNFPRRNRIIAALCDFILVVEAGVQSGTMITARLAAEMGVDVGALPGPVHSPTSQGSNLLIKDGAFCIESPEEILERLSILGHQKDGSREILTNDACDPPRTHQTLFRPD
ncbi:MAG: DNA-processing protein DprA [Silvanigrellaceae bacterium]